MQRKIRSRKIGEMCGERERAGKVARCAEKEKEKEQKNWRDVRRMSRKSGKMCGERE